MRRSVMLLLAIAGPAFTTTRAYATPVTVPDDIPTLQAVMDSVNNDGTFDTVYVRPGVITDSLYAINLPGDLMVIGLGDSLMRPSVRVMTVNSSSAGRPVTFVNLRFSGLVHTIGKGSFKFRDCRIEGGFTSIIDGSPRQIDLIGCYITSQVYAYSDVYIAADSCRFNGGWIRVDSQGHLQVTRCTFDGVGGNTAIAAHGEVSTFLQGNRISGRPIGINIDGSELSQIRDNLITDCGTGIWAAQEWIHIEGNSVLRSGADGIVCSGFCDGRVRSNVVAHSGAAGIRLVLDESCGGGNARITNNTVYENGLEGFNVTKSGAYDWLAVVTHNVAFANQGFGLVVNGIAAFDSLACNDWFANDSGAVAGMSPSPRDLSVDPRFCDIDHDIVTLAADSPLLDAPGCGLIGARGMGCASTPTLVMLFTAERDADGVRVRWQLADPTRLNDVWVERASVASGPWSRVLTERTTDGGVIVGLDRSALAEREYWYRLVARESAEVAVIGEPVSVLGNVAHRFELTRVTPNPGSGPLRIGFTLPREAAVQLNVLDLQGRHVAALVRGAQTAGTHTVEWTGQSAAAGIYFLDYRYPGGHQVQRVIRLR